MNSGQRAGVVVAVGLAAAATGIVVMAAIARWQERQGQDESLATRLRDIQEVLSDCDSKLHELERHLAPEPEPEPPAPTPIRKRRTRV